MEQDVLKTLMQSMTPQQQQLLRNGGFNYRQFTTDPEYRRSVNSRFGFNQYQQNLIDTHLPLRQVRQTQESVNVIRKPSPVTTGAIATGALAGAGVTGMQLAGAGAGGGTIPLQTLAPSAGAAGLGLLKSAGLALASVPLWPLLAAGTMLLTPSSSPLPGSSYDERRKSKRPVGHPANPGSRPPVNVNPAPQGQPVVQPVPAPATPPVAAPTPVPAPATPAQPAAAPVTQTQTGGPLPDPPNQDDPNKKKPSQSWLQRTIPNRYARFIAKSVVAGAAGYGFFKTKPFAGREEYIIDNDDLPKLGELIRGQSTGNHVFVTPEIRKLLNENLVLRTNRPGEYTTIDVKTPGWLGRILGEDPPYIQDASTLYNSIPLSTNTPEIADTVYSPGVRPGPFKTNVINNNANPFRSIQTQDGTIEIQGNKRVFTPIITPADSNRTGR